MERNQLMNTQEASRIVKRNLKARKNDELEQTTTNNVLLEFEDAACKGENMDHDAMELMSAEEMNNWLHARRWRQAHEMHEMDRECTTTSNSDSSRRRHSSGRNSIGSITKNKQDSVPEERTPWGQNGRNDGLPEPQNPHRRHDRHAQVGSGAQDGVSARTTT